MALTVGSYSQWIHLAGTASEVLVDIKDTETSSGQITGFGFPSPGSICCVYQKK